MEVINVIGDIAYSEKGNIRYANSHEIKHRHGYARSNGDIYCKSETDNKTY